MCRVHDGCQGYEIFPAVQFYSSNRVVRLLKLEATTVTATSAQSDLCGLDEVAVSAGFGALGKGGDLGYAYASSRKVAVGGTSLSRSLSLHPPPNHDGKVCNTCSLGACCRVPIAVCCVWGPVVRICPVCA